MLFENTEETRYNEGLIEDSVETFTPPPKPAPVRNLMPTGATKERELQTTTQ